MDKQNVTPMADNGTRVANEAGGMREAQIGKGFWAGIPYEGMQRVALWYEQAAIKYGPRNWEKGISVTDCVSAIMRHIWKFAWGWKDEDHLAAVVWNAMTIMHLEKFNPESCDLPRYQTEEDPNHGDVSNNTNTPT